MPAAVKDELHKHHCTNYTVGHHAGVVFTYFEYNYLLYFS